MECGELGRGNAKTASSDRIVDEIGFWNARIIKRRNQGI